MIVSLPGGPSVRRTVHRAARRIVAVSADFGLMPAG
jgi:hypothetical protein